MPPFSSSSTTIADPFRCHQPINTLTHTSTTTPSLKLTARRTWKVGITRVPKRKPDLWNPWIFRGEACSWFQGNQRTAGGQWWWSHRMSWIRGCLWCTSAGGSARNPWDAANPRRRDGLGSGWLHMFEGRWSCATTQLSCTCRQDSHGLPNHFPYEGKYPTVNASEFCQLPPKGCLKNREPLNKKRREIFTTSAGWISESSKVCRPPKTIGASTDGRKKIKVATLWMKKRIQVDSIRGLLPTIHKGETCPKEGGKSLIFPMIFKDSLTCVCLVGEVSRSLRDSSAFSPPFGEDVLIFSSHQQKPSFPFSRVNRFNFPGKSNRKSILRENLQEVLRHEFFGGPTKWIHISRIQQFSWWVRHVTWSRPKGNCHGDCLLPDLSEIIWSCNMRIS